MVLTVRKFLASMLPIVAAVFLLAQSSVLGQPTFNFKRIVNNWPTIELYFTTGCNGYPAYFMTNQNFEIYENGVKIPSFQLWCPDPYTPCPISAAILIDRSSSMMGKQFDEVKAVAEGFINIMNGVSDEAMLMCFAEKVQVLQGMTTSQAKLLTGLSNMLKPKDTTACWDAAYEAIQNLVQYGTNTCRGLIIFSDGEDSVSMASPKSIIALANRYRLRVYTCAVGNMVGAAYLQDIANATGGLYFANPLPEDMYRIYEAMAFRNLNSYMECRLEYDATCGDGVKKYVDLYLKNFCGGTEKRTKTYMPGVDSSTFRQFSIRLGDAEVKGGEDVTIPLTVDNPLPGENFFASTFTIQVDKPACGLTFKKFNIPKGSILDGVPVTITPSGNTITVQTVRAQFNYSSLLGELVFTAGDPVDTCCSTVKLTAWKFDQGCLSPDLHDGSICIIPLKPIVACQIAGPDQVDWDRFARDYMPNPFSVMMQVQNTGDKDATNVRYKIVYNSSDLTLVGPTSDVQVPLNPNIKKSGGTGEVTWNLLAKRRMQAKVLDVCIIASFDNHPDVTCCLKITIPPAGPILQCSMASTSIKADKAQQRYIPMPFDVNLTVRNDGGVKTDTVWATIIVPPDLTLSGQDAPNKHTKRVAATILPNGQATVKWELKHPIATSPIDYTVVAWIKTSNADSIMCELPIYIPQLDAPVLRLDCAVPDSLHYDEASNKYLPDPFDVSLECRNIGGLTAEHVTGCLQLPANVVLDNPSDSLRKTFNPSTLDPYKSGQPVPKLTWRVRYTKRLRYDTQLDFRFTSVGVTQLGIKTDTAETWCSTRVRGLAPAFDCSVMLPDSCGIDNTGNDVTPNPFTLVYRVWNTSKLPAKIATAMVNWPGGQGISLDPSSQSANQVLNKLLNPADTLTVSWTFRIQNRITRRDVPFNVVAIDEDGSPVRACSDHVPIANLKTALMCSINSTATVLDYGQGSPGYSPSSFVVTGTLINTGGAALHDSWVRIEKDDPNDLIEFDPSYRDPESGNNDTLRLTGYLDAGKAKSATWGFRVKQPNRSDASQYANFDLRYQSSETPEAFGVCTISVEIKPAYSPKLSCSLVAPDTIRYANNRYVPTPVELRLRVENLSTGDALGVKAFVLQSTRFTVIPPSMLLFDTLRAGSTIEPFDNPGFSLLTNPRTKDGFDTLRVTVAADGIPSTICEHPVYVMHEQRPSLNMTCSAPQNKLSYDEVSGDYVPNPFTVLSNVENKGDAAASQCQVSFIGPPRFTLEQGSSVISLGAIDPGKTLQGTWQIRALCRQTDGWDTLYFQVQGQGGMNNDIITDTCTVAIYVPACRTPEYELHCEQHAAFTFDNNTGVYLPADVTISDTVVNTGKADGAGLEVTISLPSGLYLVNGESPVKTIPLLPIGQSAIVSWRVSPVARANDTTFTITSSLRSEHGAVVECDLTRIDVPLASSFALLCEVPGGSTGLPDSLVVDKQNGVYFNSPFPASVRITNAGQRPLDSVQVLIVSESSDVVFIDAPLALAAARLNAGSAVTVDWKWRCLARTVSGPVLFRFVVTSKSSASTECSKYVQIPAIGKPSLDILFTTQPKDTLHYSATLADFEGTKSAYGDYNVFQAKVRIANLGAAQADSLEAVLLPPSGISFDENESPIKPVVPSSVPVNGQGLVSWNLRATRQQEGALRTLRLRLTSANAGTTETTVNLFVQGGPLVTTMSVSRDNVGRFGDVIRVPLLIGPTTGRNIFAYKASILYDPSLLEFQKATSLGTMTEVGWNNLRVSKYQSSAYPGKAIIRLEDNTPGSLLYSKDSGAIAILFFECKFNATDNRFLQTELELIDFTPDGSTTPLITSFNSLKDAEAGNVLVMRGIGLVTLTGECVVPLISGPTYQLKQNKPNPFNPSTSIEYELAEETDVTITVFDQIGREVRKYELGKQKAGQYALPLDASGWPSGVYTYRLGTPHFTKSMRMILAR